QLLTEVDVPNSYGALRRGIYCTVELFIPRKTPSMIISADAVVFDENGQHVAVVENGIVLFQKITGARDFGAEGTENLNRKVRGDHDAIRAGNRAAAGLSRQPGAGLDHGHHRHGPSIDAGGDRLIPPLWPEPVLFDDPA